MLKKLKYLAWLLLITVIGGCTPAEEQVAMTEEESKLFVSRWFTEITDKRIVDGIRE